MARRVRDLTAEDPVDMVTVRGPDGALKQVPKNTLIGTPAPPRNEHKPVVVSVEYAVMMLKRMTPDDRKRVFDRFGRMFHAQGLT